MNSLKTVFLAALLSAATYGVYVTVTGQPVGEPPKEAAKDWQAGATVELPDMGVSPGETAPAAAPNVTTSPPDNGAAPPFSGSSVGGSAPPYVAPGVGPASSEIDPVDEMSGPASPSPEVPTPYGHDDSMLPPHAQAESPDRYPDTDSAVTPPYPEPTDRYSEPEADRYADSPRSTVAAGYEQSAHAEPNGDFAAALASVQAILDQGRYKEGLMALSEWHDHPNLSTTDQAQLMDLLDRLAGTVIYSRQHMLEPPYTIQPGDTLERIADAYEVPWQLLAKINGVPDPQNLRTGDQLKVVRGPFDAVVDLTKFRLTLLLQDCYAGRFSIGVGQDLSTPEGQFSILNKVTNPTYYGRDVVIDPDDPANPLGERALDLGDHIWIHGTNEPQSIGRAESRGCIRLSPTDVEDVFDILSAKTDRSAGSRVAIRR